MKESAPSGRDALRQLQDQRDPARATFLQGFFKTGKGEYPEGDVFLGLTVPMVCRTAKDYGTLPLAEVSKLLQSDFHEARHTALFTLVKKFQLREKESKREIYELYLKNAEFITNWDLADGSAHQIAELLLHDDQDLVQKAVGWVLREAGESDTRRPET